MVLTSDKERVKTLLKETVTLLCKNGLEYKNSFRIEGLLGITIDEEDVFLINLNESVGSDSSITPSGLPVVESVPVGQSKAPMTSRGKRKKRPQKHTKNHFDGSMPSPVSGYDQMDESSLSMPSTSERLDLPTVTLQDLQSGGNLWDVGSNCGSESTDGASPAKRMAVISDPGENGSLEKVAADDSKSSLGGLIRVKSEPLSDNEGEEDAAGLGQYAAAEDSDSEQLPGTPIPVSLMPAASGMALPVITDRVTMPWDSSEEVTPSSSNSKAASSGSAAKQVRC